MGRKFDSKENTKLKSA